MTQPALSVRDMHKSFGDNEVLKGIDFEIREGANVALCGENGAGKSTLIKLMTGVYTPSSGEVLVDGKPARFGGPKDSIAAGIAVVHQEFSTISALTVAENIFLEKEPRTRIGLIDRKELNRSAASLLSELGIELDPTVTLDRLSVAETQMVEIAKALRANARVLILDEPTAVLSQKETRHLFKILNELRSKGLGLVYVSHRLDEIFEICTHITVIKDGEVTSSGPVGEYDHDKVVSAMVGRSLGDMFPRKRTSLPDADAVLRVKGLVVDRGLPPVDLEIGPGEIVGLSGLVGSGRTELALAIFGAEKSRGSVFLKGEPYDLRTPFNSLSNGMAMLSESRQDDGLYPESSVALNFAATTLGQDANNLALPVDTEERRSVELVKRFNVVVDNVGMPIHALSGGNQQKILIGRLLENKPQVLILDEPTRGVDVGAKAEIYKALRQLADSGVAILVISSELIEIVGLCDRVYVMRDAGIAGELTGEEITEDQIISIAAAGDGAGSSLDRKHAHV